MRDSVQKVAKAWGRTAFSTFETLSDRTRELHRFSRKAIHSSLVLMAQGQDNFREINEETRQAVAQDFTTLSHDIKASYPETALPAPDHNAVEAVYGDQWREYRIQYLVINDKGQRILLQDWKPDEFLELTEEDCGEPGSDSRQWKVAKDYISGTLVSVTKHLREASSRVNSALSGDLGVKSYYVSGTDEPVPQQRPLEILQSDAWRRILLPNRSEFESALKGLSRLQEIADHVAHEGLLIEFWHKSATLLD